MSILPPLGSSEKDRESRGFSNISRTNRPSTTRGALQDPTIVADRVVQPLGQRRPVGAVRSVEVVAAVGSEASPTGGLAHLDIKFRSQVRLPAADSLAHGLLCLPSPS